MSNLKHINLKNQTITEINKTYTSKNLWTSQLTPKTTTQLALSKKKTNNETKRKKERKLLLFFIRQIFL